MSSIAPYLMLLSEVKNGGGGSSGGTEDFSEIFAIVRIITIPGARGVTFILDGDFSDVEEMVYSGKQIIVEEVVRMGEMESITRWIALGVASGESIILRRLAIDDVGPSVLNVSVIAITINSDSTCSRENYDYNLFS